MKVKRNAVVNGAFRGILNLFDILDLEITEADRYESGWVVVRGKHRETGLKLDFQFNIEKVEE